MSATLIEKAVGLLAAGGVVAFATETVYGLGADATNREAVGKVFALKGRPAGTPVRVPVADASVARRYAAEWPGEAEKLAGAFWPGPLTLVLPKSGGIVDEVTAGLGTVGLRVPNHAMALALLRGFGGAVAAPSANRSTRVSPTTAEHVRAEFGEGVDLILDGGPCVVGIESTVLDLAGDRPRILRPGGVSRERIEAVIGAVEMRVGCGGDAAAGEARVGDARVGDVGGGKAEAMRSPGQMSVHYSPVTPAYRIGSFLEMDQGEDVGLIALGLRGSLSRAGGMITLPKDPADYARHFYAALRELAGMGLRAIYVQIPPDEPAWAAVRDRIWRATRRAGE